MGYFARVARDSSASGYFARAKKPLYQTSCGSSGRPSRLRISAATRGTRGERTMVVRRSWTLASGISRSNWKRRSISVGAIGESASVRRAARKVSKRTAYLSSFSRSRAATGCAGLSVGLQSRHLHAFSLGVGSFRLRYQGVDPGLVTRQDFLALEIAAVGDCGERRGTDSAARLLGHA